MPTLESLARVHLTGVKGTGMTALAELLVDAGVHVTGSDVEERFYTDALLEAIGVVPAVGFDARNVPADAQMLVYSAAYGADNPERRTATTRGIPQRSYTEMLGLLSARQPLLAVAGVHGKTTTTAMIGAMVAAAGLPGSVVVGSAVPDFGGSATYRGGDRFMVAETCEYRRHFLTFTPQVLIVTSIEADHLDYFADEEDVQRAFLELVVRMPEGGTLVACADDRGAVRLAERAREVRSDLRIIPYGTSATEGAGAVSGIERSAGRLSFHLPNIASQDSEWVLRIPGDHSILNAAAALCGLCALLGAESSQYMRVWRGALETFRGTRRRSEFIGEARGVRVYDDYGHHPTAIASTLRGFRDFFPNSRIIVDFMSHTYSRSQALLDEFSRSFDAADMVVLNDIYASAREKAEAGFTGETFARAIAAHHADARYQPDFELAASEIAGAAHAGDVVITMGAGNNARVGVAVLDRLGGSGVR